VKPYSCLGRVVLPQLQADRLRSVIDHVRLGPKVLDEWGFGALLDVRGVSVLFAGASGTGKTLAAHALASELGADLYVIDLAKVVSKFIGETERHLDLAFTEAEQAGAVLLFDEADALFGKRSSVRDSHDRYANIEVAYLLQRMEAFSGLAILTSNHPENIDPAFARRLRFQIDFPRPDAAARKTIWEQSIPPGAHREPDLDFAFVARALDLTGGSIRTIALHAAIAAAHEDKPIGMPHLLVGARVELMRLGNFGDVARLEQLKAA
jgi:SpoVK/Ycf46/Vps4 family AAA+-type ATPase